MEFAAVLLDRFKSRPFKGSVGRRADEVDSSALFFFCDYGVVVRDEFKVSIFV